MRNTLIAALLLSVVVACGNTSTITYKDRIEEETYIVKSDGPTLTVHEAGTSRDVPRDSIESIDHPGNVALAVGVYLLAVVAADALLIADSNDDAGTMTINLIALAPVLAGGAALSYDGYSRWSAAQRRAGERE